METEVQGFIEMFGVSIENFAFATGFVYLVVELIKRKFKTVFIGGWKTQLLALVLSFLIAFKMYGQLWEPTIALTLAAWLLPAGIHAARKNGG